MLLKNKLQAKHIPSFEIPGWTFWADRQWSSWIRFFAWWAQRAQVWRQPSCKTTWNRCSPGYSCRRLTFCSLAELQWLPEMHVAEWGAKFQAKIIKVESKISHAANWRLFHFLRNKHSKWHRYVSRLGCENSLLIFL